MVVSLSPMLSDSSFARLEIDKIGRLLQDIADDGDLLGELGRAGEICVRAIRSGNKIMFAGNGGSAADAQHLAAELVGRLGYERPGLAAISLTTDTSALTAIGNDYGFDAIFERQLDAVGRSGDALIAISTSGRSPNLLKALRAARKKGIAAIGLTGATGGAMLDLCDSCLRIPSTDTQKIQEAQIVLGHILCGMIERALFPPAA